MEENKKESKVNRINEETNKKEREEKVKQIKERYRKKQMQIITKNE